MVTDGLVVIRQTQKNECVSRAMGQPDTDRALRIWSYLKRENLIKIEAIRRG